MLSGDFEIHPGKYDNFKDEKKESNKTVSVPQSQKLAGLKTLGLVVLWTMAIRVVEFSNMGYKFRMIFV